MRLVTNLREWEVTAGYFSAKINGKLVEGMKIQNHEAP
jgi:hypothetical protein